MPEAARFRHGLAGPMSVVAIWELASEGREGVATGFRSVFSDRAHLKGVKMASGRPSGFLPLEGRPHKLPSSDLSKPSFGARDAHRPRSFVGHLPFDGAVWRTAPSSLSAMVARLPVSARNGDGGVPKGYTKKPCFLDAAQMLPACPAKVNASETSGRLRETVRFYVSSRSRSPPKKAYAVGRCGVIRALGRAC